VAVVTIDTQIVQCGCVETHIILVTMRQLVTAWNWNTNVQSVKLGINFDDFEGCFSYIALCLWLMCESWSKELQRMRKISRKFQRQYARSWQGSIVRKLVTSSPLLSTTCSA